MSVPFYFAPMATLSHRPFRELLEGFGGCDLYYSEMIGAAPFLFSGRFESWYSDPLPRPEKLVYQLVGNDSDELTRAAAILDARGAFGLDVNMGCSAPDILRSGAGIAWMRDLDAARRLIGALRPVVHSRLSVKLRLGFADDEEYLTRFCQALAEEGVDQITLHPRLAKEKLKARARWDAVARLRAQLSIPVAGNGDVDSAAALVARAASPCDAVMVGRGAIMQPWLFAQARALESGGAYDVTTELIEETAIRFLDLLARHAPPEFYDTRARRFFFYYCGNLKWGNHLLKLLNRQQDLGSMAAVWRAHFRENGRDA